MIEGKLCNDCKQWKSLDDFYRDKKAADERMKVCKDCSKQRRQNSLKEGYYNQGMTNTIRELHPEFVENVRKELQGNKLIQRRRPKI
ncbi:MAG: hypothetical protein JWN76_616 [Chitinophagaceae bacterium]|nr:hypothetical protein [Chitinophagaceae bacterium]